MKRHAVIFTWRDTLPLLLSTFLSITMKWEPVLAGVHVHVRRHVCARAWKCVSCTRVYPPFNFFPRTSFLRPTCLATMSAHLNQGAYLKCLKRLLSVPFVVAGLTTVRGNPPRISHPSALAASLWTSVFARTQTCMQIVTCACPLSLRACACNACTKGICTNAVSICEANTATAINLALVLKYNSAALEK